MKNKFIIVLAVTLISCGASIAGPTLFSDDFESGLGQWVGIDGTSASHNGIIVTGAPANTTNVLTFTSTNSGGDIFASQLISHTGAPITIDFDYRGVLARVS